MPRRQQRTTRSNGRSRSRGAKIPGLGILILAGGLGLYVLMVDQVAWHPYVTWLACWSVIAFVVYGLDKSRAMHGAWRVPEMVLHLLALIGGVAGCWAGMFLFRHKTQHPEFKLTLIVATIMHGAIAMSVLQ
jgi:uncharacterized membrane protein YsdA (DUF1294 family)